MPESRFLNILHKIEGWGTWIAYFDGAWMAIAAAALLWRLRNERRRMVWLSGAIFTCIVTLANMLDYFSTLAYSPDLSLENSPVWNSIVQIHGLQLALMFGFWGKIFLSLFAGLCWCFYVQNAEILRPTFRCSLVETIFHIQPRCADKRKRFDALCTVFSFYFACMNLFCFYVAYTNTLVNHPSELAKLPALPGAIILALVAISGLFLIATWLSAAGQPERHEKHAAALV